MSKNYTIPANTDWITLADLMGEDYDSTQYYVIHVNEITNGLLQYTCRLDMPTNEDIGQQFSNFSTIKVGTDVGDYTFLKATDTPIDVEVFIGSEDEPSPTPTPDITTGGIFPKNIAGLVMCLDGEINSRAGVHDESINGMQNLLYAPYAGKSSTTGCLEVLNGTPTFTDKGCKLGGTCFYPDYNDNEMTMEFCVEMTRNMEGMPTYNHFIANRSNYGGFELWIADPDLYQYNEKKSVVFKANNSSNQVSKHVVAKFTQTYGEKIYYSITTKLNEANSTKVYMNGEPVTELYGNTDGVASAGTSIINMGIGGLSSTETVSNTPTTSTPFPSGAFYAPYLKWYSFRKWSRRLTPDEIKQNYLQDKKRFG